jgi:glycosyltransferase involved in cell wall biosynthesis
MKLLQLCKKFPFPLKDGESIAVTFLSKALHQKGCNVTLLSMNTSKHYTEIDKLPSEFDHYTAIHTSEIDNSLKPLDAFKNLFSSDSYHISRFYCKAFEQKLVKLLKNNSFDIIQLETLYLAPYVEVIKKYSDALISMRAHNIEFEIWERITENTNFLPKKMYLKYLTHKLRNYEMDHLNDYDYLVTVSERDLKRFKKLGYKNGAMSSPIGLQLDKYKGVKTKLNKNKINLCFIGSLDWRPNEEGVLWFLDNVWDKILSSYPNTRFSIAGRNVSSQHNFDQQEGVIMEGEVPCAVEFINKHNAMIVPLFSGSGTRVKILEGMALGKIVITTSIGLEGIEAKHKKHVLIADTPEEFVEAIGFLRSSEAEISALQENAVKFVHEHYSNVKIAENLIEKYKILLTGAH